MNHTKERDIFRPIGARYLVLPDEVKAQGTTVGEFTIETEKDPTKKAEKGTIIAMGSGCKEPMKPGDRVTFGKYSGYAHKVDGLDHLVLQESELLGELISTPFDGPLEDC